MNNILNNTGDAKMATATKDAAEIFANAQECRELLQRQGFIPLVKVQQGEHWVRRNQRCIIFYYGDYPEQVQVNGARYVTFTKHGNGRITARFHNEG